MDDNAVSDVLGSTLMVGITVGLMAGLSLAMLSVEGPDDVIHADLHVDSIRGGDEWGEGDEQLRLRHLGGEPVPGWVQIRVTIDGTSITYTPSDQGFADGELTVGESWTVTDSIQRDSVVSLAVIDPVAEAVVLLDGEIVVGKEPPVPPVIGAHYVDDFVDTFGVVTQFSNARSASDGGDAATLTESLVGGVFTTVRLSPATLTGSGGSGLSDPDNLLSSDNADASFGDPSDNAEVQDFTLGTGDTITRVVVGFEGSRGGGGSSNSDMTLSYTLSGSPGATSQTFTVSSNSDADHTVDITGDRTWTEGDVDSLHLLLDRDSAAAGFRDPDIDHMFVEVTTVAGQVSELDVEFLFEDVAPSGTGYLLEVRYQTAGDTFHVDVWDGGDGEWERYGPLASTTSRTTFSHVLIEPTPGDPTDEYNGGDVIVRFIDTDLDTGLGVLQIDYARVVPV